MSLRRAQLALRLKHHYLTPLHVRNQHEFPHKEYFQNPATYPPAETTTPEYYSTERPLSRRLLRSMLWAGLFTILGFAYVEVPKTVRWLDRSKRDSKREEADMQEIKQKFKDDPLVQILEADPSWHSAQPAPNPETEPYPFVEHSDLYMSKAIGGSEGLQMVGSLQQESILLKLILISPLQKFYRNPSKAMMCCIVHVGEGVEWGPRTAHAGGLASFIEDSLDWLGSRFTLGNTAPNLRTTFTHLVLNKLTVSLGKSSETSAIMSNKLIQIDFLKDVPTGQLYAFWMLPAICLGEDIADVLNVQELRGPKLTTDELKRTVIGMLERRDSLPYEPGNSERYARARVTYDADPTKPASRAFITM
jgi:hypothetical protein